MNEVSCQFFDIEPRLKLKVFGRSHLDYNIDYIDSNHTRHTRKLVEKPAEEPAIGSVTDYEISYIPHDPLDGTDTDFDYYTGSVSGDAQLLFGQSADIDSLTSHVLSSLDEHLADPAHYDLDLKLVDSKEDIFEIFITNKKSRLLMSHLSVTLRPNKTYTIDFYTESHRDLSADTRIRDAQFSGELIGVLLLALEGNPKDTRHPIPQPRTLEVGHPTPQKVGSFEHSVIETYSWLGFVAGKDKLPAIDSKLRFSEAEVTLAHASEATKHRLALLALRKARNSGKPLTTELLNETFELHLVDLEFEQITKDY